MKARPRETEWARAAGVRLGQLLAGLNTARHSVAVAHGHRDLLPQALRVELEDLHHRLAGLEQAAWKESQ